MTAMLWLVFSTEYERAGDCQHCCGQEEFQIPLVLARRKSIGKWYYGDEARRLSKSGEMVCIDQLLKRALNSEK
ncbi:MAG: hypothetical protein ACLRI8_00315 [Agathobacter rectalis]